MIFKKEWLKEDCLNNSTIFSIGNGHIGYRGCLEEEKYLSQSPLSVNGFYDQKDDKWRENVLLPDPFCLELNIDKEMLFFKTTQELSLQEGIYSRYSENDYIKLETRRFASSSNERLICERMTIEAKTDIQLKIKLGFLKGILEINGPHFQKLSFFKTDLGLHFSGLTNEGEKAEMNVFISSTAQFDYQDKCVSSALDLKQNERVTFEIKAMLFCSRLDNALDFEKSSKLVKMATFDELMREHVELFFSRFNRQRIVVTSDAELQLGLDYSNYILTSCTTTYRTSIPARGFTGETYKGAIFWDTEVFLLPFYLFYNQRMARDILLYRIDGLKGAKEKAKRFKYDGAFYAWESQEEGKEACTMYSVTDRKTGKGIRTYFVDKQIHISADVALAFKDYLSLYKDRELFLQSLPVLYEVYKFYKSYAVNRENRYHFDDVIGPDEYHERVNDNAFTNYRIYLAVSYLVDCIDSMLPAELIGMEYLKEEYSEIINFRDKIYLPKPNAEKVIEQFEAYYSLEDVGVEDVRKRLKDKDDYWGGRDGVATKTRVIKQADVIALVALHPDLFSLDVVKANYDFYKRYTEHGSSLSKVMYALVAYRLGFYQEGYDFMKDCLLVDLKGGNKEYAGGIYIGGSHLASMGGGYLVLLKGLLDFKNGKYQAHLGANINSIEFTDSSGVKQKIRG